MTSVYRYRPYNDYSIDELNNSYLWFSTPIGFKDVEDSNISSFVRNNESIRNSFDRKFNSPDTIIEKCKKIGICCFTKELPQKNNWNRFPKGGNGFFIEYDKEILERHFLQGNCFRNVEYYHNPLKFSSYRDHYDIEWERNEDGILYRSLREIENDIRLLDQLFLKMFTRINIKYKKQNEVRIILAGVNAPNLEHTDIGLRKNIPTNSIKNIYLKSNSKGENVKKIIEVCSLKNINIKIL